LVQKSRLKHLILLRKLPLIGERTKKAILQVRHAVAVGLSSVPMPHKTRKEQLNCAKTHQQMTPHFGPRFAKYEHSFNTAF
jgi:hypothetical protein